MTNSYRFILRRNAALIGGWFFGLYALVAELINHVALPSVPLAEPPGGLLLQVLIYAAIGAVLGIISTIPEATLFGAVLGGATGAIGIMLFNLVGAINSPNWFGGMAVITLIGVLPITLMLTPVSWAVRFAAEALSPVETAFVVQSKWKRTILTSFVFIFIGAMALYPTYVRDALQSTNSMVQKAIDGDIPPSLEKVWGFPEGAQGSYQMEWSEDWQNYAGTYSSSLDQMSAFLVRVRFDNGFVISCLASSTTRPVCLNEQNPFGQ